VTPKLTPEHPKGSGCASTLNQAGLEADLGISLIIIKDKNSAEVEFKGAHVILRFSTILSSVKIGGELSLIFILHSIFTENSFNKAKSVGQIVRKAALTKNQRIEKTWSPEWSHSTILNRLVWLTRWCLATHRLWLGSMINFAAALNGDRVGRRHVKGVEAVGER